MGTVKRKKPLTPAARAGKILDILGEAHPEARCALTHEDAFQLSVATILSAQCTDERVNKVTPALFARYPDALALAGARSEDLEALIRSTGFFRAKAKNLTRFAKTLIDEFGGEVPKSMEALTRLPGFGRKTANVVLGHAFGIQEGIAVDTHVLRLSNRLGIAKGDDPVKIERQLMSKIPPERWTFTTDVLIFHGRKICDARKPRCGDCPVFGLCRWESRQSYAAIAEKPGKPKGRKR